MASDPPIPCASCGDALDPDATYFGFIGSTQEIAVCEACALWHSNYLFVRGLIDVAQRIIDTHAARMERAESAVLQ